MPADLSQLKDIHLPNAIHDWPIAYGWWLLVIMAVFLTVTTFIAIKRYRAKNATKKAALNLLNHQYAQFKENKDSQVFLQKSNQTLKRYCLEKYPQAVGLAGLAWTDFLIRHSQKSFFNTELSHALSQGIYQKHCHYNADDLFTACSNWLKNNNAIEVETEKQTMSTSND